MKAIHFIFLICCFLGTASRLAAQETGPGMVSSGDNEIDEVRREMQTVKTGPGNFAKRALLMKLWVVSLQQQGADLLTRYLPIDDGIRAIESFNPVFNGGEPKPLTPDEISRYGPLIDRGLLILDSVQRELALTPTFSENPQSKPAQRVTNSPDIPWPHYKGNEQRTGFTGADGPVHGRVSWTFPVGLAWESAPVVREGRVYLTSPGMRNILFVLDLATGKLLTNSTQTPEAKGDQLYSTPALASTPILVGNDVVVREMGSRGNRGIAKDVVIVDAQTGEIRREIEAGHVDYRAGYAPVAANANFLVFPVGVHDIEQKPPVAQPFNRLICKDYATGRLLWDFNLGPFFSEPLLENNRVFVGTESGYLYALKADGRYPPVSAQRIAWEFHADGPINRKGAVSGNFLYVGSNGGSVYCLDKTTGKLIWQHKTQPTPHAYRQFSTPFIKNERLFIGSADSTLYCLDSQTGKLLFSQKMGDWIRAAPVADDRNVYAAALNGQVYSIDYTTGKINWQKRVGNHFLYADLTLSEGKLLLTDSDLYAYCLDAPSGSTVWRFSIIKSFEQKETVRRTAGSSEPYRIQTDQLAGGAYYQSKPTAAGGRIFIGTPSRFVYALDAETGRSIWKFELSAAVSGAPVYANGKIYVGQQGGDERFYCLDAQTGQMLWTQNVGWVWGSVNVSDGLVFIPGIDGYVNCLDAETGRIIWRYRTERSTCGEPLVLGDKVYFGGWDHYLYCFEKRTGKLLWKYQLSGGSDSGAPIAEGNRIFLPVGGGTFRCLDATTGEVLWVPTFGATVFNVTPAVHNGQVFISTLNGRGLGGVPVGAKVYALDAATGKLRWEYRGAGGLTGPVVGNNRATGRGSVYVGSTVSPYFLCLDEKGNADGTTNLLWKVRMANKTEESVPALYRGGAYILSSGGFLYAIE